MTANTASGLVSQLQKEFQGSFGKANRYSTPSCHSFATLVLAGCTGFAAELLWLALANTMPASRPIAMLATFFALQTASKKIRPKTAMGSLLSEPTRLKVVAVVVDRNHRLQKLISRPQRALRHAAAWNRELYSAGSYDPPNRRVRCSHYIIACMRGPSSTVRLLRAAISRWLSDTCLDSYRSDMQHSVSPLRLGRQEESETGTWTVSSEADWTPATWTVSTVLSNL